ncbi:MAG: hypothetical protein ACI81R_000590 [Bradymonadia bacterium]|jgi:hypothetical protein
MTGTDSSRLLHIPLRCIVVAASARNLSWLVHALLTSPEGLPLDRIKAELGVADRTYRKYRAYLQYEFKPFTDAHGNSRVEEVAVDGQRWLRLRAMRTG